MTRQSPAPRGVCTDQAAGHTYPATGCRRTSGQDAECASTNCTTARPGCAEAAETTNPDEVQESEQAEGVEQEGTVEAEAEEQAETTDQPAGQEIELTADSEIVLPNGERWSGAELQDGLMKKADYTRKTQALSQREQTLERYTGELQSKVQQIEQDLAERDRKGQEVLEEGSAKRDYYAEQIKRLADAQREHVTQWDKVDWDAHSARAAGTHWSAASPARERT